MDLNWQPARTEDDSAAPEGSPGGESQPAADERATEGITSFSPSPNARGVPPGRRLGNRGIVTGALLVGGIAGAVLLGPAIAAAQTPSTSPSASARAGTWPDHRMGGHLEAVSDTSVAAKAIGITEADLITALNNGQTMAAVAKAHNVDPQAVIDALVADGKAELAAAVKAGTITQAQADAEQAEVVARVTAQVNGTFPMGGPGMGGHDNDGSH